MRNLYFNDGTLQSDTQDMDNDVLDNLELLIKLLKPSKLKEFQAVMADQRLSAWITLEWAGGVYDVYLWWA